MPKLSICFRTASFAPLADRHHSDERGDANEDAEHGERRPHHVAADRLDGSGEDHDAECP